MDSKDTVKFHYVKSNYFRVIHGDGAFGGLTPRGELFLSIYSERAPLPDVTVQAIENDQLGPEIIEQRKVSDGIVREMEVGIVMDLAVAKSLIDWLTKRVEIVEEYKASAKSSESELKK
jgi:hypothetical protein